ncbi:L,D-transpeptidase family protein [Candidatus Berkelbacteria bacterium]|nr:L,D-transpeptidase family protein [Candidatus Berkelbacteria bacterium]
MPLSKLNKFKLVKAAFILKLLLFTFSPPLAHATTDELVNLINQDRSSIGLQSLNQDSALYQAAFSKAKDMLAGQYFEHTSPAGKTPWAFVLENGYDYAVAGENLAIDFKNDENAHFAFMRSAKHRANILNPDFEDVAVAEVKGEFENRQTTVIVEMFGAKRLGGKQVINLAKYFLGNLFLNIKNRFQTALVSQALAQTNSLKTFEVGRFSHLSATETQKIVEQELKELAQEKITLTSGSQALEVSLEEMGVELDAAELTVQIQKTNQRFFLFRRPKEFSPLILINLSKFNEFTNKIRSQDQPLPLDAELVFEKEKIKIASGKAGFEVDAEGLINEVGAWLDNEKLLPLSLSWQKAEPKIKEENLADAKAYLEKVTQTPLVLLVNEKKATITSAEIFGWYKLTSLNEDKLKETVAKKAAQLETKVVDKKVYPSGEVADEGRDGLKINQDEAIAKIKQALASGQEQIVLTTVIVTRATKIIQPEFNPGLFPGKYIEVNLSNQKLYQFEGENKIGEHLVSTGKWSMQTPIGTFSINNKTPRAYSATYNLYMPYWMSFIGGKYGIHELPEWANGYKEGQNHLGTPVSHGCIRLGVGDAQAVYDWAEVGTVVYIHK